MSHQPTRRQFLQQAGASAAAFSILSGRAHGGAGRPPNILLFFPDQHRPDWTSIDKHIGVRTPNLERIAREGVRFTQSVCPAPVCAPSRACLALGREYGRAGVPSNSYNLADGAQTFYLMLRDAGYRVGSVGKADLRKGSGDWGIDGLHQVNGRTVFREWGFTDGLDSEGKGATLTGVENIKDPANAKGKAPYTKMLSDRDDGSLQRYLEWFQEMKKAENQWSYTEPMNIPDEAYNDNWVGQNGLNLVENFPKDQPWFLQVNFPGPHPPVDITPSMAEWYAGDAFPDPHKNDEFPPEKHRDIRRNYSAMVENIDRWFGRYLEAIERRGETDNTLLVWSSDHGEMLGDHNLWGKQFPYHPSVSVPLVVSGPGIRKGFTYSGPATTLDLPATFLDYAGVARPEAMDSETLRPLLEGKAEKTRSHVLSGLANWRAVFDGRYKLVHGYSGGAKASIKYEPVAALGAATLQLFDLQTDPWEDHNIADAQPDLVKRFAGILEQSIAREG